MVSVKVMFDYEAEQPDELTLKVGDIVCNVDQQDDGWWEGELDGKKGMFPENFVELIKEEIHLTSPGLMSSKVFSDSRKKARVTFQYDPEQPDELALEVGDIVEVIEDDDEGWWKGMLNGKEGVFPSNFVELIKEEKASFPEPLVPEPALLQQKPKSQMGFGLKLGDLSRDKLKKIDKDEDKLKPTQTVPPMDLNKKKEADKKLANIPPSQKTVTVQKAKVTFAYEAEQEDELNLQVGDVVVITSNNVFEGWYEGELNGKRGLFPDNFVEVLPAENIHLDPNTKPAFSISSQQSVRRPSKQDPVKQEAAPVKPHGPPLIPPGAGNPLKAELEKKLAGPGAHRPPLPDMKRPPPPESKKPFANKGPAPPPPSSKPKPTVPNLPKPSKPRAPTYTPAPVNPPAPKIESSPAVSAATNTTVGNAPRSLSVPGCISKNAFSSSQRHIFNSIEINGDLKTDNKSVDLDSVKPTDPLKNVQRPKGPSKKPPSKYKVSGKRMEFDWDEEETGKPETLVESVDNSKDMNELQMQVIELKTKISDIERKFKKLVLQVTEDLDNERKLRLSQQSEIDTLKRQLKLLSE